MDNALNTLNFVCDMLDTYSGRDKVLKIFCYAAKLASGICSHNDLDLAKRLAIFSSKISGARTTLRLLDDIPMLQCTLQYGLGAEEADLTSSVLGVIANAVDTLYYPVEKICWLAENKCVTIKNVDKWELISSIFWVLSIYLNLMRTCRKLTTVTNKANNPMKLAEESRKTKKIDLMDILTIVRLTLDLSYAISSLPRGWLWGGRLSVTQGGAVGTLSAAIGIYQYVIKKRSK